MRVCVCVRARVYSSNNAIHSVTKRIRFLFNLVQIHFHVRILPTSISEPKPVHGNFTCMCCEFFVWCVLGVRGGRKGEHHSPAQSWRPPSPQRHEQRPMTREPGLEHGRQRRYRMSCYGPQILVQNGHRHRHERLSYTSTQPVKSPSKSCPWTINKAQPRLNYNSVER